jgi:hypothetical protein
MATEHSALAAHRAKYHALNATSKWKAFQASMLDHSTRSVADREREDRDRKAREVHNQSSGNG